MSDVFDHLTIRVSDFAASRRFYDEALGLPTHDGNYTEWEDFGIVAADQPGQVTRRLHVGFGVEDRAAVDAWWLRMTEAGYRSDGEPGPRPEYTESYYGGFILDPDGNSVEAVHHHRVRTRRADDDWLHSGDVPDGSRVPQIDHVWLRTRDVLSIKVFYETIAPAVGIERVGDDPDRVRFSDGEGSFTFVTGDEPTHNAHFAFGVPDFDSVKRFHEAATAAGYRDNGAPGERPQYHPGYFAAYVFDPDGHNVEAVFHDRSHADG
jgi:catechol 2,3-dioxygenase-like lactoylglutathione lyase family enzyme